MIVCFLHHLLAAGGAAANHVEARDFIKEGVRIRGVVAEDRETGKNFNLRAKAVINATGVYADRLRQRDNPDARVVIAASQGIHLVFDGELLGGRSALMIPKTADGRVLFAIPWQGRILFGTTDTARDTIEDEPNPLAEEIDYLLGHAAAVFARPPSMKDVRGIFAGLRPLPKPLRAQKTSAVIRDFHVECSDSGLLSIYGGKWTTCRAMGEAAINKAVVIGAMPCGPCRTREIVFSAHREPPEPLDAPTREWVHYAVKYEMARTVADLLLRRCRLGVVNAAQAHRVAPECASWMAEALGRDDSWVKTQIDSMATLCPLPEQFKS